MPSLRKKFTSYFRQLSFHNEPRNKRNNVNENAFVTKYLQGHITLHDGPPIFYGKNPTDLPNYEVGKYETGTESIIGCYSGPNGGLTTVTRTEKHLSLHDDDIDFIDTPEEEESIPPPKPKKSPIQVQGQPIDNTTMVIKVAGHEYCVTNKPKRHSKSFSLSSISDIAIEVEKTKIDKEFYNCDSKKDLNANDKNSENQLECDNSGIQNNDELRSKKDTKATINVTDPNLTNADLNKKELSTNKKQTEDKSALVKQKEDFKKTQQKPSTFKNNDNGLPTKAKSDLRHAEKQHNNNYSLSKSKSEGNPFNHKKRGKVIQVQRMKSYRGEDTIENLNVNVDDSALPSEWNRKSDCVFGLSDSLYDQNQVTKCKNGDPIADCFGVIARNDSAILAVADGVNWGEKASIAAKSAIHASLHYLNKTIFNDTKPFEKLTTKTDDVSPTDTITPDSDVNLIANTREVFICLLRAFNCAHDLILENKGMLTTLTVAVILPLKQKSPRAENGVRVSVQEPRYVCCVCNVGDTLAYVYSQKYGIRELTKGSHDVNSNRDMRDALGALGPVDGINPELSNLTLSVTTINKGDIVMVASDGLTDNFDPNVCRFSVNSTVDHAKNKTKRPATAGTSSQQGNLQPSHQSHHIPSEIKPDAKVQTVKPEETVQKPPVKPPRKSKTRSSVTSITPSERSSSSIESAKLAQATDIPVPSGPSNEILESTSSKVETDDKTEPVSQAHVSGETKQLKKPLPVIENKASSLRKQASNPSRIENINKMAKPVKQIPKTLEPSRGKQDPSGYKFLKSKTSLDLRTSHTNKVQILRNEDGIPYVTPIQRYELQLLLMEDILKHGISGNDRPITTSKKLCESLVSFTISITSAKRRTLEDMDMYFDNRNGILVEVSSQEKKHRRKKVLEKAQLLPGKLDHVSVVACNIGNFAF